MENTFSLKIYLLFTLVFFSLASCKKDSELPRPPVTRPTTNTLDTSISKAFSWQQYSPGLMAIFPGLILSADGNWGSQKVKIESIQDSEVRALPFVDFEKVTNDTTSLFYTVNPLYNDLGDKYGPVIILGRQNRGFDFTKTALLKLTYPR